MKPILILKHTVLLWLLLFGSLSVVVAKSDAQYRFDVQGVDKDLAGNVLIFLNNLSLSCDASERMREGIKQKIPEQVQLALQPYGYYRPRVEDIEMQPENGCWLVRVKVAPREPVRIRQLSVNVEGPGQDHEKIQNIDVSRFLSKGRVFVDPDYQALKQTYRQWANDYGFLDAHFSQHRVDVFPQQLAADIALTFETGPRYRLQALVVEQKPDFLNPRFLHGLVGLETEQYINSQDLIEVRKRLVASRYFDNISVSFGDKNTEKATVPVRVLVTPGYRIDYSVGLGYTTDTGARSTFEYQHHRLNERGFQLSTKLQLAQVNNEFTARMKFPSISNPDEKWYEAQLGHRQENNDVYKADTTKIGLSQTRLQTHQWQNINFIDVLKETYTFAEQKATTQLLVPGTAWTYQDVDNPLNPRFGFKAQMDFKLATEDLLSDMSMVQVSGRVKSILPVASQDRLILRAEIGTTATSDFNQLPATYRYFAGGDQSVRGFDYKRLSPQIDGINIGGKHLAVASVEYEHRLFDNYALAFFADGGNAFTDQFELAGSVGLGFRWFSPIGPLRVDLGVPVTDADHQFRIHVSLGPDL